MLKISRVASTDALRFRFRLEGRLIGPWVEELRTVCEPLLDEGALLELDLAEVSYADNAGAGLLVNLHSRAVAFVKATPFLEQQIRMADETDPETV